MKNNDSFSLPPVSQILFKRSLRNDFLKNTTYFYKYYSIHKEKVNHLIQRASSQDSSQELES